MTGWQDALVFFGWVFAIAFLARIYVRWCERRIRREVSETLERHRRSLPPDVERYGDD